MSKIYYILSGMLNLLLKIIISMMIYFLTQLTYISYPIESPNSLSANTGWEGIFAPSNVKSDKHVVAEYFLFNIGRTNSNHQLPHDC